MRFGQNALILPDFGGYSGLMATPSEMLALYLQAEADLLQYGQSSAFDGRMLTMADLDAIRKGRREWEQKVASEEGAPEIGMPHSLANLVKRA
jgi:hypothetical protein